MIALAARIIRQAGSVSAPDIKFVPAQVVSKPYSCLQAGEFPLKLRRTESNMILDCFVAK